MDYRLGSVHLALLPERRFYVPGRGLLSFNHERAKLAALTRHHPERTELADAGRRRLKVLRAERLIKDLTTTEPMLDPGQLAHLALLLLPGRGDGHAA